MANSMKLTIILPVYNVEKYLPQCLDAIITQNTPELEVICVNDGSTDRSPEILEEYARKDGRFRIITQANKGLSGARNAGLEEAQGEYVFFCDSDDWIEPDSCANLIESFNSERPDVILFKYQAYKEGRILVSGRLDPIVSLFGTKVFSRDEALTQLIKCCPSAWAKIYRTEFLSAHGLWFVTDRNCIEDIPFWVDVLLQARRFQALDRILYTYRQDNPNSLCHRFDYILPGHRLAFQRSLPMLQQHLEGEPLYESSLALLEVCLDGVVSFWGRVPDRQTKDRNFGILKSFYRYSRKHWKKELRVLRKYKRLQRAYFQHLLPHAYLAYRFVSKLKAFARDRAKAIFYRCGSR